LFHDFVDWIQHGLGKFSPDGQSWSEQLHESLSLWNVTEGTHVLTLMFFAGTIWIIDLRMMGIAFRNVPFSKLNDRVLPITIGAFAMMVITGVIAAFGRDPLLYYHDIWFRLKMIFLLIATINIFWFHYMVQKSQPEWDNDAKPPPRVRLSGLISMCCWIVIIAFGRFIAYDFLRCDKVPEGSFVYVFAECKQALSYLDGTEEGGANDQTGDDASDDAAEDTTTDGETPPAEDTAPATPAPAQPAPGQGN
jgi:hypothetical protein